MKKLFLKNIRILIVIFVGLVVFEVILLSKNTPAPVLIGSQISEQMVREYAEKVVADCKGEYYHPACYDKNIPQLMAMISMEDAFRVTKVVQQLDSSYWYCHVLGHNLSAWETRKDPSKWKEVIARAPAGMCSNGAIHGAFQERFRKASLSMDEVNKLKPELETICEPKSNWNPTKMQQASCYHAMGHLMMYMTNAKTAESVKLCDEVVSKKRPGWTQLCYDGVFMQIFQPLEPEDFALVRDITPKRETLDSFCSQFVTKAQNSCHSESWPLFSEEIATPNGFRQFCSYSADATERDRCYLAEAFVVSAVKFNLDSAKISDFCASLGADLAGQCLTNSASRIIETDTNLLDRAVSLCAKAEKLGEGDPCWKELVFYSTYNFKAGSQDALKLCNSLPDSWRLKCLEANKVS